MILTKETLERKAPYFFPKSFDVYNRMEVSAAFDELELKQIENPRDLLSLLYQSSELMGMLNEAYNELHFRTLADSEDTAARMQLQAFTQDIILPADKRNEQILMKYYNHPLRKQLNQDSYRKINRLFEVENESVLADNDGLTLEINDLVQEYRQAYNQVFVTYQGNSYPLNIINHLLSKADPEDREAIWIARKEVCFYNKEKFEHILDKLIKARNKMAAEKGFKNYYEYSLASDYLGNLKVSQVEEIHNSISKVILPVVKQFIKQRQLRLKLKTIRPWNLEADLEAGSLTPYSTTDELVEKAISILYNIRFDYGIQLNKMYNSNMLDLEYRPTKAKGEFYAVFQSWESGKILMNGTGQHRDMVMFFHEMGHILQTAMLLRSPLAQYSVLPVMARELASQSLVYLSTGGWDEFYPDTDDLKIAFRSLLEYDLMQLLYWSVMNSFELVLYANPEWTSVQREKAMQDIWKQYDWGIDWSGLEDWQSIVWMQELNLFEFPQYGFFSALSVFSVWQIFRNYRIDPLDTVSRFQTFLEKGAELSLDEMFHELNIRHDYSERNMRKILEFILSEYKKIGK